jgi:hypothetical protein
VEGCRSAPSPSLRPITTSAGSSTSLLTVTSAPSWERAFSRRESALSIATTRLGPYSRAVIIAASPTGPAPTTATTSPGRTLPFSTPTSKPVRGFLPLWKRAAFAGATD